MEFWQWVHGTDYYEELTKQQLADMLAGAVGGHLMTIAPGVGPHNEAAFSRHRSYYMRNEYYRLGADLVADAVANALEANREGVMDKFQVTDERD